MNAEELLRPWERAVLEHFLSGDNQGLTVFRQQIRPIESIERRLTGAGFLSIFTCEGRAMRSPGRASFWLGDVAAEVRGLAHGAGFLLLVKNGLSSMLEGYSYEEP